MMRNTHGWPRDPASVRILIVDDDGEIQLLLRSVLAHLDHANIEVVRNRAQALVALREHPPHIVFLDINLADGESGFSLLEHLVTLRSPPFVAMISSASTPVNFKRAMEAGAGYFLVKPFNSAKVRSVLDKFHSSRAQPPGDNRSAAG